MYKFREFDIMRKKLIMAIEEQLRPSVKESQTDHIPQPDLKLAALLSIGHHTSK